MLIFQELSMIETNRFHILNLEIPKNHPLMGGARPGPISPLNRPQEWLVYDWSTCLLPGRSLVYPAYDWSINPNFLLSHFLVKYQRGGLTCAIYVLKLPFFNTYEASEPSDIRFLTEKQSFKDDIFVNKRYLSGHRYE